MNTTNFYATLPVHRLPLSVIFNDISCFTKVPEDWFIVVTDIEKSSQAKVNGHDEHVNLIATGSIIAVLNIALKAGIDLPFFFGGDGGTLIIPKVILEESMSSLAQHQKNASLRFGLNLRIGAFPLTAIYAKGHQILISKVEIDQHFYIPVISGKGLLYADTLLKSGAYKPEFTTRTGALDLSGMECRWDKIKPPLKKQEIICLLVAFKNKTNDLKHYSDIMNAIERIYGKRRERNPISVKGLHLNTTWKKLKKEAQVRLGSAHWLYIIKAVSISFLAKWFFFRFTKKGKNYLNNLISLSDTLVLDGRINTVITGTIKQRKKLINLLDQLEKKQTILYGIHVANESVMSCYVRDRKNRHIHFVDGAGGGYTLAAKALKEKIHKNSGFSMHL